MLSWASNTYSPCDSIFFPEYWHWPTKLNKRKQRSAYIQNLLCLHKVAYIANGINSSCIVSSTSSSTASSRNDREFDFVSWYVCFEYVNITLYNRSYPHRFRICSLKMEVQVLIPIKSIIRCNLPFMLASLNRIGQIIIKRKIKAAT